MQPAEILAVVANATIAQGLTVDELEPLLAPGRVVAVEPGQVVIAEGEDGDTLYIVLQGRLRVELRAGGEAHPNRVTDLPLNTLQAGDCFGEYSLIDARPTSASVVAVEPTLLLAIARLAFAAVAETHDKLAKVVYRNLLHTLVWRLRKKDRELDFDFEL